MSFRCGTRPVIYRRKVQHLLTFSKWTSASRDAHKENIHKVEQRTLSSYPSRQESRERVEGRSLDDVVVEPLNDRRYPSRRSIFMSNSHRGPSCSQAAVFACFIPRVHDNKLCHRADETSNGSSNKLALGIINHA